ncbi:hypothetical protein BWK57_11785 [Flavobacterium columnare]|uniref:type IV secretion system protein n=1 Tax=Flavobacterium columnare TaxID=996 RepID=UPI000CDB39C0|nr:type IV secretion system protein [Flavobacterium columnare]POR20967.1 hypothetical protein BWK57_11785 [Flavobacterium columnare]
MDFTFINELRLLLEKNNIFMYSVVGAKACALALLLFKILQTYLQDFSLENPSFKGMINIFAYAFFIVSSDWIINTIENVFSSVDLVMSNTSSDLYTELYDMTIEEYNKIFESAEDWMDYIGIIGACIIGIIQILLIALLGICFKIADLSMTAGYLISRVFFLQLMKFIFPFVIALSTIDSTKDLLGKWIKKYVGMFILGIAYIGILHFCSLVQLSLTEQFSGQGNNSGAMISNFIWGVLITMIVTFTIKVSLFQKVTSWVTGFFI